MSPPPDGVTAQSRWPCGTAIRTYSLYMNAYILTWLCKCQPVHQFNMLHCLCRLPILIYWYRVYICMYVWHICIMCTHVYIVTWYHVKSQHDSTSFNIMKPRDVKHDDVVQWKHFPCYWPFGWRIHRSRWFPAQRPVTWSFDVIFDLRLNKRLSRQSWGWWFEMLSRPL